MNRALVDRIVARIYRAETAFSRNKNFEAYQDPEVRRAARICRQLKSLEADLLAHGSPATVSLSDADELAPDGACIRVTIETLECRRTAFLTRFELELLCENPRVRALLGVDAARPLDA